MPTPRTANSASGNNLSANLGFEAQLWQTAYALRGSMDAAEYKHVVLGLIFLKYISDAFEQQHARLEAERSQGADPEDPDECRAASVFWVPPKARWAHLQDKAKQPSIGEVVDGAMEAIEKSNPSLKSVLPRDYARPALDKQRLGQLIDLVSNINLGGDDARAKDVLGRVYEYFLSQFASAEGKKGGEFYTPGCIVKLLVEMLEPFRGRVYDPCCGSSGMFVQSVQIIRAHASGNGNGGKARGDISIYGQELNYTTWRLAKMNLALRGIDGQIARTYHAWRLPAPGAARQAGGEKNTGKSEDVPGFSKSAALDEIRKHDYVLAPGRYVGAEALDDDGEPFEEKMKRLGGQWREQRAEASKLDAAINANLKELGYDG